MIFVLYSDLRFDSPFGARKQQKTKLLRTLNVLNVLIVYMNVSIFHYKMQACEQFNFDITTITSLREVQTEHSNTVTEATYNVTEVAYTVCGVANCGSKATFPSHSDERYPAGSTRFAQEPVVLP